MNKAIRRSLMILSIFSQSILLAQAEDEMTTELSGEALLINESTSGLPGNREDIERNRLFLWLDLETPLIEYISFGASFYANVGTDEEEENRWNLDNSPSNKAEIVQTYLDWNFSETSFLRAGKQYLPIKMSSMVWDRDISAVGLSFKYHWVDEGNSEFQLTAGKYTVDHLFSDDSHLSFIDFHLSAPVSDLIISSGVMLMQVSDTGSLLTDNVQRTNTPEALEEGFDIVIADLSINFSIMDQPILAGIETSKNFAMDKANQAHRINLVVGDNRLEGGLQFNLHYQDIERDASVAAYVDDEWWFATWMTGYRFSTSYGITEDMFIQASYFNEALQANNTKRVYLELRSFF